MNLDELLVRNRKWAEKIVAEQPDFFEQLARQQKPQLLWIGCADSRVPANEIMGLMPGEVFVHRNVANMVVHTDLNCLSVIQYAVDVLKVEHIIVTGHYSCGGVAAALANEPMGLIDNWLRNIQDVWRRYKTWFDDLPDGEARVARLCEVNVMVQVMNLAETTVVQAAWRRGQKLAVHGWIYGINNGILKDLDVSHRDASPIGERMDERIKAHLRAAI